MSYLKIFTYSMILIGIYLVFRFLLPLALPFVIASVVTVFYYPLLRRLFGTGYVWKHQVLRKWLLAVAVAFLYGLCLVVCCLGVSYLCVQGKSMLLNYPFYEAKILCLLRKCCGQADMWLQMERGDSYRYISGWILKMSSNVFGQGTEMSVVSKMTSVSVDVAGKIIGILFDVIITVVVTFFLVLDYEAIRNRLCGCDMGKKICHMVMSCKETLKVYLKAQGCIMLLDGAVCTLAFYMAGQPYFLLMGPVVAVVDALPILGAGCVLIPYALYLLISGAAGKACIVGGAYVGCVLIRQITEPNMIGKRIGIHPVCTILSMYVGVKLFGVAGFLLGPVGILAARSLVAATESLKTG